MKTNKQKTKKHLGNVQAMSACCGEAGYLCCAEIPCFETRCMHVQARPSILLLVHVLVLNLMVEAQGEKAQTLQHRFILPSNSHECMHQWWHMHHYNNRGGVYVAIMKKSLWRNEGANCDQIISWGKSPWCLMGHLLSHTCRTLHTGCTYSKMSVILRKIGVTYCLPPLPSIKSYRSDPELLTGLYSVKKKLWRTVIYM